MQVTGRRSLRRLDLGALERLVPAVVAEWHDLVFDDAGSALDPRDGTPTDSFRLVSGTHRAPGARYLVRTPQGDEPPLETDLLLRRDDPGVLAVTVSSRTSSWSVEAEVTGLPEGAMTKAPVRPRCELSGSVDLAAELRRADLPGPVAWLVGRSASGTAVLDAAALDEGPTSVATAHGRLSRAAVGAALEVTTGLSHWDLAASIEVTARGLAGLVLRVARRWVEPHLVRGLEQALNDLADADEHQRELADLAARTETAGGPRAFVRSELWGGADADRAVVGPGTYS